MVDLASLDGTAQLEKAVKKKTWHLFSNDVIKNEFVKFMSTRQCHLYRKNTEPMAIHHL
jgi:hypothetical protein